MALILLRELLSALLLVPFFLANQCQAYPHAGRLQVSCERWFMALMLLQTKARGCQESCGTERWHEQEEWFVLKRVR
eukprot:scaffold171531_cov17-Tisochrysis_lutea.AAC.1